MNQAGPPLKSRRLWAKREDKCLAILERALLLLLEESNPPETEVELNRRLYWYLLVATRELYPKDDVGPISECNTPCDTEQIE
jgi:hypothetical protein